MTQTMMWVRAFDHAFSALAFATITVVSLWLSTRKYIGHRTLLVLTGVFACIRSVAHVNLTFMAFYGVLSMTTFTTVCTTLSAIAGIMLAVKVIVSVDNIQATLTHTEAQQMLKVDKEKDADQAMLFLKIAAEGNRDKSSEMLASLVGR